MTALHPSDKPRKVLVVDDEADVQRFLRAAFEDAGYIVEAAGNGQEALEKIEADAPDLLVLDVRMPVLDGWGVLERLRRMPDRPAVVILSAFPDDWRALRAGAWECIEKPFDLGLILEACSRALQTSPRALRG